MPCMCIYCLRLFGVVQKYMCKASLPLPLPSSHIHKKNHLKANAKSYYYLFISYYHSSVVWSVSSVLSWCSRCVPLFISYFAFTATCIWHCLFLHLSVELFLRVRFFVCYVCHAARVFVKRLWQYINVYCRHLVVIVRIFTGTKPGKLRGIWMRRKKIAAATP